MPTQSADNKLLASDCIYRNAKQKKLQVKKQQPEDKVCNPYLQAAFHFLSSAAVQNCIQLFQLFNALCRRRVRTE